MASEVREWITPNLNPAFNLRPYQTEALIKYDWVYNDKREFRHLLFQMATGSGKTLIMAGILLDLYKKGFRDFIFFAHRTVIIEKTRANFLNPDSSKYLFADTVSIDGTTVEIVEVPKFGAGREEDMNIVFTTLHQLDIDLNKKPSENGCTYGDFRRRRVVLISDEAHHTNASTREGAQKTWEETAIRIFKSHPDNYLFEFTATADLENEKIYKKYENKHLVDYPLREFRASGYSKEVMLIDSDVDNDFERALLAVLLSQYRLKVFVHNRISIKPVILFKSSSINSSEKFFGDFVRGISALTPERLERVRKRTEKQVIRDMFQYFVQHGITFENLVLEIQEDFSSEKCVMINSKPDQENQQKQLIVNSIEDADNPYRALFSVDKLNEGWDVLNLFDIVRQPPKNKKGTKYKETISEAQLIGRGARYCPFRISEEQPLYQRKYDDCETSKSGHLKICEHLYYHCEGTRSYITQLTDSLKESGVNVMGGSVSKKLVLKDSFRKTDIYTNGVIYLNEQVPAHNIPEVDISEMVLKHESHIRFATGYMSIGSLDDRVQQGGHEEQSLPESHVFMVHKFREALIRKALNRVRFYRFDNLVKYIPYLRSVNDFLPHLRHLKIGFSGNAEQVSSPTPEMRLQALVSALEDLSSTIKQEHRVYRGTKKFKGYRIKKIFGKDSDGKTLHFTLYANSESDREFGKPQSESTRSDLQIDLSREDWYAFNENYGTSEEKHFVRYVKNIKGQLPDDYELYLLRNAGHFKLYTFDGGSAFEPDFAMFIINKQTHETLCYQIFVEPKGEHLLSNDDSQSKEVFLKQITEEYGADTLLDNRHYRLIGMPLYNKEKRGRSFDRQLKSILNLPEVP